MRQDMMFRAATAADLPVIEKLLMDAKLPLDGVQTHLPGFVLALHDDTVVGAAGRE